MVTFSIGISEEIKWQLKEKEGRENQITIACIGGGSNAAGTLSFLTNESRNYLIVKQLVKGLIVVQKCC
jgi:tryptophan synthase beta chain